MPEMTTIHIDDLDAPRLTERQRAAIASAPPVTMDVEAVLAAAVDALSASRSPGTDEAILELAETNDRPPVLCDAAQVIGRKT